MNFKEWVEKYKPIMTDRGVPYAFETYGGSNDFIRQHGNNHIWTLYSYEGEVNYEEELSITCGYHIMNRLNYFVTEVPWELDENGMYINVNLTEEDVIYYGF